VTQSQGDKPNLAETALFIDRLGGTVRVAQLCQVEHSSVSNWRVYGMPRARMMYLRAIRPDVFTDTRFAIDQEEALE
jgi:hypothetical protein